MPSLALCLMGVRVRNVLDVSGQTRQWAAGRTRSNNDCEEKCHVELVWVVGLYIYDDI